MKFSFSSDPIVGKSSAEPSKYQPIIDGLTPEANCVVFDDTKDAANFKQRLEVWASKTIPGAKVRSTMRYPTDGKPRVWLVFPEPVKTTIRGPFPNQDDA